MAAGCPGLEQEVAFAFGKNKQSDLVTGNVEAGLVRWNAITKTPFRPDYTNEDDSEEAGNDDEFAQTLFPVSANLSASFEAYLTSLKMAWAVTFGMGAVAKTGAGPYVYTATPLDRATDGCELNSFSILQSVQSGAILDELLIGNVLDSFEVALQSGPGRASSQITLGIVGTGIVDSSTEPDMPAKTTEFELSAASLAMTALGNNLVTLKRINSLNWGFRNNISEERKFYPGSGVDSNGFALAGRMQPGKREAFLNFNVDFDSTASAEELADHLAQATGTVVIGQTYSANEKYVATFQKVGYRNIQVQSNGGFLNLQCDCVVLRHPSNGVLSVAATTAIDGIGEAEA